MPAPSTFSFPLDATQRASLLEVLRGGAFRDLPAPAYATAAGESPSWHCNVVLYASGKCVVQGKGAREFVENVMEPMVLRRLVLVAPDGSPAPAAAGAAKAAAAPVLSAEALSPHVGVDESGKGDFLGPLVVAAAYTDADLGPKLLALGVRDSKQITSDRRACEIAAKIRALLGPSRYSVLKMGCRAYNRLHAKMRNVNRILSWAHARCIENVLERVPECPMAISDQFGRADSVKNALLERGRRIEFRSRPRAESDIAVAAASLLAREAFLQSLAELSTRFALPFPKGAAPHVRKAAEAIARKHGPAALPDCCKLHFRTLDEVLAETGLSRADVPAP